MCRLQWENAELSSGDFLFLDRGAAAGVAVGDSFRLFDQALRVAGVATGGGKDALVEVGNAVVVRVSPEFSTAYVTKSAQSFMAGAKAVRGAGEAAQ